MSVTHQSVTPSAAELAGRFDADGVVIFANDGSELTVSDVFPANAAVASLLRIATGFGVTGLVSRNGQPALIDEDSPRNQLHRQLLGLFLEQSPLAVILLLGCADPCVVAAK